MIKYPLLNKGGRIRFIAETILTKIYLLLISQLRNSKAPFAKKLIYSEQTHFRLLYIPKLVSITWHFPYLLRRHTVRRHNIVPTHVHDDQILLLCCYL